MNASQPLAECSTSAISKKELCLVVLWLTLACLGLNCLSSYVSTPGGESRFHGVKWTANNEVDLAAPRFTLLMVVHPQCPCSKTSLSNLKAILSSTNQHVKAYILFVKPAGFSIEWVESDLWKLAQKIPGVTAIVDEQGILSRRLGAQTSGQIYLYDAIGNLAFSGGITEGRGHEGDNLGMRQVIAIANGGKKCVTNSSVYGCTLFSCTDSAPTLVKTAHETSTH